MHSQAAILPMMTSGIRINFDLLDRFSVPESAPMASPHTCDVAGALTLVQNDGQMSVANGIMTVPAQATPAFGDLGYYSGANLARAQGRMIAFQTTTTGTVGAASQGEIGYGPANVTLALNTHVGISNFGAGAQRLYDGAVFWQIPADVFVNGEQTLAFILGTQGSLYFNRYNLYLVMPYSTYTNGRVRYAAMGYATTHEYIASALLPAPFDTAGGIVSYSNASPTVDTLYDALVYDGYHKFTVTLQAGETMNYVFRYYDANNFWTLRWVQSTGAFELIETYGGAETSQASGTLACIAGTAYDLFIRSFSGNYSAWISRSSTYGVRITASEKHAFKWSTQLKCNLAISNLFVYPTELSGKALTVLDAAINPFKMGGRIANTINVPDGAVLDTYAAMCRGGDTLSLFPNGNYTTSLTALPSGYYGNPTKVIGNGATIKNTGTNGISFGGKSYVEIDNVKFTNNQINLLLSSCRHITVKNCVATLPSVYDNYRIDNCYDVYVSNCEAGKTNPVASDGFELYGGCTDITFDTCTAHECTNGFEIWTGARPAWQNKNILMINCNSYDNKQYGYSTEGGVQALNHPDTIVRNSLASGNVSADASGVDGATLHLQNCPGFTTSGSVVVDF